MLCVGIVVADVSFAAGSLARCVLYFGSWRQQRLRGFQQESAIEFRTAFTRVFGISRSVIVAQYKEVLAVFAETSEGADWRRLSFSCPGEIR
ncbi:hypothetical protein F511_21136 [Dorcoceras hygrometricum]|uniref:Uncharacterized protein n=1 Tax=Dorcoceras hygrometricum TaxID=472368 RepID=A0A2Z7CT49_9LAMI|nr:hypothetical protein F511_21136 [Dorcoceras hygrometricum]